MENQEGLGEVRRSVGSGLAGGSVLLTVGGCSRDLVGHRDRWVTKRCVRVSRSSGDHVV